MTSGDRISLIDRLRALPAETEWLEIKRNPSRRTCWARTCPASMVGGRRRGE